MTTTLASHVRLVRLGLQSAGGCGNGANCRFAHGRAALLRRGAQAREAAELWLAYRDEPAPRSEGSTPGAGVGAAAAPPGGVGSGRGGGSGVEAEGMVTPIPDWAEAAAEADGWRGRRFGCTLCGIAKTLMLSQLEPHQRGSRHRLAVRLAAAEAAAAHTATNAAQAAGSHATEGASAGASGSDLEQAQPLAKPSRSATAGFARLMTGALQGIPRSSATPAVASPQPQPPPPPPPPPAWSQPAGGEGAEQSKGRVQASRAWVKPPRVHNPNTFRAIPCYDFPKVRFSKDIPDL